MKQTHRRIILTGISIFFLTAWVHGAAAEGLTGYYYQRAKKSGPVVVGPPDQVVIDRKIDFATNTWNWRPFGWQEHFSVHWTGWILIEKGGSYTFATFADDGADVYLDDRKIIDNPGKRQEPTWMNGAILLGEGYHKIDIVYYNWKDSSGIGLYWDKGSGHQIVPSEILFPEDFRP